MECRRCGKPPSEITEYVVSSREERMTPEKYVRQNEGTYNSRTEKFWCTGCYIREGMPLGKA